MTDRYTELVKQAYEAQMAREGPAYVALTGELTAIDADLEALSAKRETTISALESMDEAVEGAKEALDAYFAGRDEDGPFGGPGPSPGDWDPASEPSGPDGLFEDIPTDDEYATAKAAGAN